MHSDEPSLLAHVEQLRGSIFPEGGLSNVIFVGKTKSDADMASVLDAHREIVEEELNSNDQLKITGLLMGQANSVLHFLEGPCQSLLNILSNLCKHVHFANGTQAGRIIYSIEDRPERIYPEWYSSLIQERRSQVEDVTTETAIDVVHNLAMGIIDVGRGLQRDANEDVDITRYADKLPGKNLIIALSNSNDFFSLEVLSVLMLAI